jgi:phthiocerol/phenolphthiocerol synthesis type-I polyketide synthase E
LLLSGDVAKETDLHAALQQARERFGQVNGVIHAAGVTSGPSIHQPFEELTAKHFEVQFRPKVGGTRMLARVLQGANLDFVLLISSNASVLGGLGLAAYAAANRFMDLFAAAQNRKASTPWISTGWDTWPTRRRQLAEATQTTAMHRFAMSTVEVEEAFARAVSGAPGHVVISAVDINERLPRWPIADADITEPPLPSADVAQTDDLDTDHSDVSRTVTALWREMIGVQKIRLHDNYFELGGDSLLASRMITRLNRILGVNLGLRSLFEAPTVAGLSEIIERQRSRHAEATGEEDEVVL